MSNGNNGMKALFVNMSFLFRLNGGMPGLDTVIGIDVPSEEDGGDLENRALGTALTKPRVGLTYIALSSSAT